MFSCRARKSARKRARCQWITLTFCGSLALGQFSVSEESARAVWKSSLRSLQVVHSTRTAACQWCRLVVGLAVVYLGLSLNQAEVGSLGQLLNKVMVCSAHLQPAVLGQLLQVHRISRLNQCSGHRLNLLRNKIAIVLAATRKPPSLCPKRYRSLVKHSRTLSSPHPLTKRSNWMRTW